jgi:6-phosphogluconolactonase
VAEQTRLVTANWVPHLNAHRLTMTFPLINSARNVAIIVTDDGKAAAVKRALQPELTDEAPVIAMVQPKGINVGWYLTRPAASHLRQDAE